MNLRAVHGEYRYALEALYWAIARWEWNQVIQASPRFLQIFQLFYRFVFSHYFELCENNAIE